VEIAPGTPWIGGWVDHVANAKESYKNKANTSNKLIFLLI
jgi:hypothetical protein